MQPKHAYTAHCENGALNDVLSQLNAVSKEAHVRMSGNNSGPHWFSITAKDSQELLDKIEEAKTNCLVPGYKDFYKKKCIEDLKNDIFARADRAYFQYSDQVKSIKSFFNCPEKDVNYSGYLYGYEVACQNNVFDQVEDQLKGMRKDAAAKANPTLRAADSPPPFPGKNQNKRIQ